MRENPRTISVHHWAIALAALYKIGTREAFELAKRHFSDLANRDEELLISQNRALFLYALLACKMGELGHAYDILNHPQGRPHYMRLNMKLKILVELGHFEDALLLIRNYLSVR